MTLLKLLTQGWPLKLVDHPANALILADLPSESIYQIKGTGRILSRDPRSHEFNIQFRAFDATKVTVVYYADAKDAFLKVLGE